MRDCSWLSDRIPELALGRAEWTPEEARHLSECVSCRQEWEIVRAAGRLGHGVVKKLEPDATARTLLQRLGRARTAERLRRRSLTLAGFATAAAIAAAVWIGGMEQTVESAPPEGSLAAGRFVFPLPELESLQPAELDSVLQTMDDPNHRGSVAEEPDLGDLSSDELERVLDSWEG